MFKFYSCITYFFPFWKFFINDFLDIFLLNNYRERIEWTLKVPKLVTSLKYQVIIKHWWPTKVNSLNMLMKKPRLKPPTLPKKNKKQKKNNKKQRKKNNKTKKNNPPKKQTNIAPTHLT